MRDTHLGETSDLKLSLHAKLRMAQRSTRSEDLDLMRLHATAVDAGYVMRDRDVREAVGELRERINRLERLRNRVLIVDAGLVVTTYHGDRAKQKRLLAGGAR